MAIKVLYPIKDGKPTGNWRHPPASRKRGMADLVLKIEGETEIIRDLPVNLTQAQAIQEAKYRLRMEIKPIPLIEQKKEQLWKKIEEIGLKKRLVELGLETNESINFVQLKAEYQKIKQELKDLK